MAQLLFIRFQTVLMRIMSLVKPPAGQNTEKLLEKGTITLNAIRFVEYPIYLLLNIGTCLAIFFFAGDFYLPYVNSQISPLTHKIQK